ncbi:hypothetical protein I6J18_07575 [Peribacillus psychrosaccharolyticus]|uniref:Uncharacterized protein n=1 Tax=Peribacillus psychrosaccharolyticus TaxID=1407 RepID=A0A974S1P9_PERPY|nr:hypothetical protein [Peribacillus psychrosaccharolyticus]MEC2057583.1 hypothetical protein [Peribacillus psychrosaccharolyticus]MED3746039.1 hypothetical protein [Peribacillus psychrosaccharolyticus]QQT01708.1 hypothetical protein I6J18_07575 [Peribacillus psychrosaccharolyticus]
MSTFIWILCILVIIIILYSLYYSLVVLKTQKDKKRELDPSVEGSAHDHPYLLNPIFLALIFAAVVVAGFIFYYVFK